MNRICCDASARALWHRVLADTIVFDEEKQMRRFHQHMAAVLPRVTLVALEQALMLANHTRSAPSRILRLLVVVVHLTMACDDARDCFVSLEQPAGMG